MKECNMTNEGMKNRGCGIPAGHGLLKTEHSMRTLPLVAAAIAATGAAHGVIVTEPTRTYAVGYNLADVVNPGAFFQQTVTDSDIVSLTDVRVGMHLVGRGVGGFAGELVVSLNKDLSVTSLLLNRVGVSAGNSFGFGYDGWNVTLADDGAGGDIHAASLVSGILTGEFAPDGRTVLKDTRPARNHTAVTGEIDTADIPDLLVASHLTLTSMGRLSRKSSRLFFHLRDQLHIY
jgi:hypothetical protein